LYFNEIFTLMRSAHKPNRSSVAIAGVFSHGGHGDVVLKLDGHTHGFRDTHHTLSKDEVTEFQKLLELAGIDPTCDVPLESRAA
jgi:hypothetical protein